MQITFLIGNGFDSAMGLHTSYPFFYDYCEKVVTKRDRRKNKFLDECMGRMKSDKTGGYRHWEDLEKKLVQLGEITDDDVNIYKNFHHTLGDNLVDYIKHENDNADLSGFNAGAFLDNIKKFIEKHCPEQPPSDENIKVDFIVFNYTNILDEMKKKISADSGIVIGDVVHVHGLKDEHSVVFGVADASGIKGWKQLKEESQETLRRLLEKEKMIADNYRLSQIKNQAESLLRDSAYIVAYGVAFGETDAMWWHIIRDILKGDNNKKLIRFVYPDEPKGELVNDANEVHNSELNRVVKALIPECEDSEIIENINKKIKIINIRIDRQEDPFHNLGVHRKEELNGLTLECFVTNKFSEAYKMLILWPTTNELADTPENQLTEFGVDERLIERLSVKDDKQWLSQTEKNIGRRRIYYLCFDPTKEEHYEAIGRLLNYREDDLEHMQIDSVILLINSLDSFLGMKGEDLESVMRNIEWYIVERMGKEWDSRFLVAAGNSAAKKGSKDELEELLKANIDKSGRIKIYEVKDLKKEPEGGIVGDLKKYKRCVSREY